MFNLSFRHFGISANVACNTKIISYLMETILFFRLERDLLMIVWYQKSWPGLIWRWVRYHKNYEFWKSCCKNFIALIGKSLWLLNLRKLTNNRLTCLFQMNLQTYIIVFSPEPFLGITVPECSSKCRCTLVALGLTFTYSCHISILFVCSVPIHNSIIILRK